MKTLLKGIPVSIAIGVLAFAGQAQAYLLTPDDADWSFYEKSALQPDDVAEKAETDSILEKLYKSNSDGGTEEGSYQDDYATVYSGEPNHATITFDGTDSIVCPECYLLVKNGRKSPQYLFDIGDWDGLETIYLEDFYLDKGDISHVGIFGKSISQVPESSALILMGLGLIGLGMARRRVAR